MSLELRSLDFTQLRTSLPGTALACLHRRITRKRLLTTNLTNSTNQLIREIRVDSWLIRPLKWARRVFPQFARQNPSPSTSLRLMGSSTNFSESVRTCAERMAESGVSALGGLFDLTSQRLVRYAATITRNQHDAEDAVQAALVRVAGQMHYLCDADAPWPYLLRMVRNEALQILRRKKRWSLLANLSDLLTGRLVDEMEREESHRAVWSALRTLPTEQAEVVVLKIWEEMTFAEIGKILEVSTFTAASRYRYAMLNLTQKLTAAHVEVAHE